MSTQRKVGAFAATTAFTVGLIGIVAAPSYATDSSMTSLGSGTSAAEVSTTPDGYADTPEVRKLKSLVGTQTQEEILAIQKQGAIGADVQVLAANDGSILAAYVKSEPSIGVRSVKPGVANAATPSTLATQDIDGVRVSGAPKLSSEAALLRYVAMNATATTIDSSTGALVSVAPAPKASAKISERNTCQSGDAYSVRRCITLSHSRYPLLCGPAPCIASSYRTAAEHFVYRSI